MAEIVYRQMPAPRDIPQKIPAPRAKIRMQKPQSGGEFSVQIPGGARGGMVMAKIDNCITFGFKLGHFDFDVNIAARGWGSKKCCQNLESPFTN